MLRKIRESLDKRDEGFTLIELLVVVIIIGILAAIAIPVFLNQRKKAWDSAVKSDLKNAATAQETYLTEKDEYTLSVAALAGVGFNQGADVVFSHMEIENGLQYCMQAYHASNPANYFNLDSNTGEPVKGAADGDCNLTATTGTVTTNTAQQTS